MREREEGIKARDEGGGKSPPAGNKPVFRTSLSGFIHLPNWLQHKGSLTGATGLLCLARGDWLYRDAPAASFSRPAVTVHTAPKNPRRRSPARVRALSNPPLHIQEGGGGSTAPLDMNRQGLKRYAQTLICADPPTHPVRVVDRAALPPPPVIPLPLTRFVPSPASASRW